MPELVNTADRPANIVLLQSQSLTMLVQRELERMILSGEIAGGEKLNEINIATRLGVSRGPVRESFRALEETGLVRIEKNRGVFVREISIVEADDIYELRATLDQLAGSKLAKTITAAQSLDLRSLLKRMAEATERNDLDSYHPLNLRFHDALVEYAGNQKLLQFYRRLVNELSLFRRQTLAERDRLPTSTAEHKRILSLIESGNAAAAGQALYEHAMASRTRMHAVREADVQPTEEARPAKRRKAQP